MFSKLRGYGSYFIAGIFPVLNKNPDYVDPKNKTATLIAEETEGAIETGSDRLYYMFSTDEFGEPSPEILQILHVAMTSMVVGGCVGGFVQSRVAFLNFVENNDATKFQHHLEAKRLLQDKVMLAFWKGVWKWGWRLTAFTSIYSLISTSMSVYRGKTGILEHTVAGAVSGASYKVNIGVRGIVVGGTLGAFLGSVAGLSILGILSYTNKTMQDVRLGSVTMRNFREGAFKTAAKAHLDAREPDLLHEHDANIGSTDINLDKIPLEEGNGTEKT